MERFVKIEKKRRALKPKCGKACDFPTRPTFIALRAVIGWW